MKRMLIALAVLASMQVANAQVKTPAAAQKALEAAKTASENPKAAAKAATWLKLGKAYVDAYDAPIGNVIPGMSKTEISLLAGEKPTSTENVVLGGETFEKQVFASKNLYYAANGALAMVEVTKPVDANALDGAVEAYKKAYSLDPKKEKDIVAALNSIKDKYVTMASNDYNLGNFAASSAAFTKAAEAVAGAPVNVVDTLVIYNAGLTAFMADDKANAIKNFKKCYEVGYYATEGDVFSKLAALEPEKAKTYLEEGFAKYPESQRVLFDLINYYTVNNEDPNHLFQLLKQAQQLDPNNASLYYVEGNIHKQLGQLDEALASYRKCAEVNPAYEYGYVGEGMMFYDKAIEYATKASEEVDDKKYEALATQYSDTMKKCIEPFEKAYEVTQDEAVKRAVAEYLKNVYYRFQTEGDSYKAGYDKYNELLKTE